VLPVTRTNSLESLSPSRVEFFYNNRRRRLKITK